VIRVTAGKIAKLNFGASLGRVVDLDLTAKAFVRGTTEARPELDKAIRGLLKRISDEPSTLHLTYVARSKEEIETGRLRLRELEKLIKKRWRGQGNYRLLIEKTVVEAR